MRRRRQGVGGAPTAGGAQRGRVLEGDEQDALARRQYLVIIFIFLSDVVGDTDELKEIISNLNLAVFKKAPTKSIYTIPSLIMHTDQERHTGRTIFKP